MPGKFQNIQTDTVYQYRKHIDNHIQTMSKNQKYNSQKNQKISQQGAGHGIYR